MSKQSWVLLCWWILVGSALPAHAKYFSLGDQSTSPDGRFMVQVVELDRDWKFKINDRTGDRTWLCSAEYNPIHALVWSADSQTIIIVEQASEGTFAGLMRFNGTRWIQSHYFPTKHDDKWTLLSWKIGRRAVHLDYELTTDEKGRRDKEGVRVYDEYRCNLSVNLRTGRSSKVRRTAISDEEMHKLNSDF